MTVTSPDDAAPQGARPGAPASRGASLRRLALPAIAFAGGLAAATLLPGGGLGAGPAGAQGPATNLPIAALEVALAEAAAATARAEALTRRIEQAEALRGPQGERFIAAALLLQAAIATPRPWLREYQALTSLAPPGALPAPLAEVLLSHAARGLPTEAVLRIAVSVRPTMSSPRGARASNCGISTA
jgi:hypothetical protein